MDLLGALRLTTIPRQKRGMTALHREPLIFDSNLRTNIENYLQAIH